MRTFTKADIPGSGRLKLPVMKSIQELGGSAQHHQIPEAVASFLSLPEEIFEITYENTPERSVFETRVGFARSECKLIGLLENPRRGLSLLTETGYEILALSDDEAREKILTLWRAYQKKMRMIKESTQGSSEATTEEGANDEEDDLSLLDETEESNKWERELLSRLHELSPLAFEKFVLYMLRTLGLELEHVGGPGDKGIDGIGLAPISSVISEKVAVQVKRFDPQKSIGRDVVALFQHDANNQGAQRAILVTLGHFTPAARKASQATIPTVSLIDGEKLCQIIYEQTQKGEKIGLRLMPEVDKKFFARFES